LRALDLLLSALLRGEVLVGFVARKGERRATEQPNCRR
jgi:hypothetical protein